MTSNKNQEYVFNGLFNYDSISDVAGEFKGELSLDKRGFFKGSLAGDDGRFDIVGHLRNNKLITNLAFILLMDDFKNPQCIYNLFNSNTNKFKPLEGYYIGGWYLNPHEFNPKLLKDYNSFRTLADSAGPIGGYAEIELKKK